MKANRLFAALCTFVAAACTFAFAACGDGNNGNGGGTSLYTVAMPDGAPALAAAQLMAEDMQFGKEVTYTVVNANAIGRQVSGGKADVCILPVNAAAQLAGDGKTYKLLGTVTHGNLYMLSSEHTEEITAENIDTLVGKTVGCIQLDNFVGGVLKMILEENGLDYEVVEDASAAQEGVVNLIAVADPATISPSLGYDYYVCAEPLVTAKTSGGALSVVGDIQALYGEEGFPQAVMVAKNSVIASDPQFISDICAAVTANSVWLETADTDGIVAAINKNYGGATSSLNANNLNATVISRCAIEFVPAAQCRQEVVDFLAGYSEVSGLQLTVSDAFFYNAQ